MIILVSCVEYAILKITMSATTESCRLCHSFQQINFRIMCEYDFPTATWAANLRKFVCSSEKQMTVNGGCRKALYFSFSFFFNKIKHKLKRKQIRWHFISLPAFSKHISKQNNFLVVHSSRYSGRMDLVVFLQNQLSEMLKWSLRYVINDLF